MLNFLFLILALLYISAACMVVFSKNSVHSVLFLILVFFLNVCFFFLLGADFLAFVFLIIYVGAIAVLFLFIVMMLNIKVFELTEGFLQYVSIAYLLIYVFFIEIDYLSGSQLFMNMSLSFENELKFEDWFLVIEKSSSMYLIGMLLYTYFLLPFILCGLILLLAMIGSISLTLNYIRIMRREDVFIQVSRDLSQSVKIVVFEKN